MTRQSAGAADPDGPAVEFKGRVVTATILRVHRPDLEACRAEIAAKVERKPEFYRGMPFLLDVSALAGPAALDLGDLAAVLRESGLVPVALHGRPSPEWAEAAERAGLGFLPEWGAGRETDLPDPEPEDGAPADAAAEPPRPAPARPAAKIRTTPVRSGQQCYARGTDLVVLAPVSHGAEVLADGCIHVYGALRGRALAGAHGDETARIFCTSLDAELVAIAGRYRVSEEIPPAERGGPVEIRLAGDAVEIRPLGASAARP